MKKRDVRGALAALEKAIGADASDPDAHMLYQDVARDIVGAETLTTNYRQRAKDKPDEPLWAFLYARMLPPDQALAEYEKLITKFPQSPWPHVGRARALEMLNRIPETGAEYDLAVSVGPREIRFKVYQAMGLETSGSWAAAVEAWKLILLSMPKDRAAKMGLGESLRKTGAFDDAIATFTEIAKADPTDPEPVYRIGMTQLDADRLDDSLKTFESAIAMDRLFVEAYCAAAEVQIKRALATAEKEKSDPVDKDFQPAIDLGKKAVAIASDNANAHFTLGAAEEAAGEDNATHYDNAAIAYDNALNLMPAPSPEKVRVLCAKSFVLLRLAKWDQAIATADKALGIDEKCIAAYLYAGHALAAQAGRQDEAIKNYYRKALKFAPDDARVHHGIGVALWEGKHEQDAKKELEAAVKSEPTNMRYRLTLGELYYQLKMYRPAGEMLVKVVDSPDYERSAIAWGSYGRVCSALKDWEQAAEAYEKVCAILDPKPAAAPPPAGGGAPAAPAPAPAPAPAAGADSVEEHLYLAIIYQDHLKKRDKAKVHIRKFIEMGGKDDNLKAWIDDLQKDP